MDGGSAVPVTWFLKNSAQALGRINAEGAPLVLTRKGRSVAVILDLDTYAWLEAARRARERSGDGQEGAY